MGLFCITSTNKGNVSSVYSRFISKANRYSTLASVGAAVILLSLPLDLFFQQIIQYPYQWTPLGNSTIARTVNYDPIPDGYFINDTFGYAPEPLLFNTAYPNFYQDVPAIQPNISCPTSRCTWDDFDTLALCSTCTQVPSQYLEFGCFNASRAWMSGVKETPAFNETVEACGWFFLPDDGSRMLLSGYALDKGNQSQILAARFLSLRNIFSREPLVKDATISFKNMLNPLGSYIISTTDDGAAGAMRNGTATIQECAVSWCVQTIRASMVGSILSENITRFQPLQSQSLDNVWSTDNDDADPNKYGEIDVYYPQFELTLPDSQSLNHNGSTFMVNNITSRQVIQVFDQIAPSSFTATNATRDLRLKYMQNKVTQFERVLPENQNPWMNNATEHFAKIVKMMSYTMRRQYGVDNKLADFVGTAWEQRVHVHIRWPWVVLPGTLLLFSLLFLIATVMRSSKDDPKIGIWKTSALAVLFNGPGDDVQNVMGENPKMGYAREKAKNMVVTLEDDPEEQR